MIHKFQQNPSPVMGIFWGPMAEALNACSKLQTKCYANINSPEGFPRSWTREPFGAVLFKAVQKRSTTILES